MLLFMALIEYMEKTGSERKLLGSFSEFEERGEKEDAFFYLIFWVNSNG